MVQLNPDQKPLSPRDTLFYQYYPMVKSIARKWATKMPPSVELDDLITLGCIGLMNAIDKYEPERAESFAAYVRLRINGAILDDLRAEDVVPRTVREMGSKINKATEELQQQYGRPPTSGEVADYVGLSLKRYREVRSALARGQVVSLDSIGTREDGRGIHDVLPDATAVDASVELERQEFVEKVQGAVGHLKKRYKDVVHYYYVEELTMKEIGVVMNVSEARVCQIHKSAMSGLKKRLSTVQAPPPRC